MERDTIELPGDLLDHIRTLAKQRGVSKEEVIRRAVDAMFDEDSALDLDRRASIIGIGASDYTDTAREAGELPFPPRTWR